MKFITKGISMQPVLSENTTVSIHFTEKIKVGDVVVFLDRSDRLVAHRLHYLDHDFAITKGDNFNYFDPVISRDHILGKIVNGHKEIVSSSFVSSPKSKKILVGYFTKQRLSMKVLSNFERQLSRNFCYEIFFDRHNRLSREEIESYYSYYLI